jgi:hypothetical protein
LAEPSARPTHRFAIQSNAARTIPAIAHRIALAIEAASIAGMPNFRRSAARSTIQCHAVCAINADNTITPSRSGTRRST